MRITEVEDSGCLQLACVDCGEMMLLLGRERDWYEAGADGRPRSFVCGGCGGRLTLANRVLGAGSGSSR